MKAYSASISNSPTIVKVCVYTAWYPVFIIHPSGHVPQGSVLGPLMFAVCTAPVQDMLKRHAVEYHKFAGYLQIYTSYYTHVSDDTERVTQILFHCISEIKCWMVQHKLKLNDEKTELMVSLSPHHPRKCGLPPSNLLFLSDT